MLKIEIESELRYRLKSNESMLLDNPETFWIVQSGVISLFAVPIVDGVVEGTRHYLFSVQPGEALLSTIQTADGQGILAVSAEECELLQLPREQFSQRIANADPEIIALVENWIDKLGAAISANSSAPIGCYPISPATHSLTLTRGQCCETAKTSWLQIQQGSAKWMGLEELTVNPTSGLLPLGGGIWLLAEGNVELTISSTVEIQSEQTILDNLAQLQIYCLRCIDLQQQNSLLEDWVRFQQRQQMNRQVAEEAVGELATVLQPRKRDEAHQGTLLLIAAGAVGRALGVEIRPPARSENLERVKEPLEAIARASKLRMRRVLLTDNWWHQDCGPLLGYMTDQSPVALLPISTTCYELFNPVDMTRTRVDATIRDRLSQEAYTFYRPLPQAVHKAWDFLKFGLEGQTRDLLTVFIAGIATTLLGMLVPQATAILIDNVIPDTNRGLLLQVGLGLFAAACGVGIFRLAQGVALLRAESLAESSTQAAIWNRLLSLGIPFFRAYSTGELEARVSAINKIRRTLGGNTLTNLFSSLFSLLNLGLLFYYSTSLALIAVAVALLAITFTITSSIMTLQKVRPLEKLKGQIQGLTVQLISGVTKLRVAAAEVRAFAYWSKYYSQQQKLVLKTERIENNLAVFNELLPLLSSILLFAMAVDFTHKTPELSIGNFLAFNTAFGSFLTGATSFTNSIVSLLEIIALWEQAKPILEAKPEVDDSKADPGRLAGKLAVDHVTFRYGHDGPITLDDVSLNADPGEFIALVGPSGSGKSTIFRLLLGFETSASGAIYYDGQDLSGLDTQAVRRQLGVVLQNNQVTSASIFENISGGALITLDEAWDAARSAGFADDITAMPMGMHTVVSEGGTNLSGGQRQRLLIARALALKPRILLFDEATSALDNRTQSIVSDSLNRLQVTRVVIAHRLSTIQNADRIYVLQAGRVVQQGTFEELTHQEGLFAQLMARQIA